MKRVIMTMVLVFMTILSVSAQENEFYVKSMLGGTLSTLTKIDNAKMKLGLVAGGELCYHLSKPFAVSSGLLISMQGAKFKDKGDKNEVLSTLTYINVPILANYYVVPGLAMKAGIQPGYLLTRSHDPSEFFSYPKTIINGIWKFDLSIPLGISYEFSDFVFDFRYNMGISRISKHGDAYNSVFMLTFGYKSFF